MSILTERDIDVLEKQAHEEMAAAHTRYERTREILALARYALARIHTDMPPIFMPKDGTP